MEAGRLHRSRSCRRRQASGPAICSVVDRLGNRCQCRLIATRRRGIGLHLHGSRHRWVARTSQHPRGRNAAHPVPQVHRHRRTQTRGLHPASTQLQGRRGRATLALDSAPHLISYHYGGTSCGCERRREVGRQLAPSRPTGRHESLQKHEETVMAIFSESVISAIFVSPYFKRFPKPAVSTTAAAKNR